MERRRLHRRTRQLPRLRGPRPRLAARPPRRRRPHRTRRRRGRPRPPRRRRTGRPGALRPGRGSWGGYLVLLGLGTQPALWACGVAENPVGDYAAAYEEEFEGLRWVDRAMFGGSPAEVPGKYAAASPLTYADAVRAPLLVLAAEHDPRCPPRQVENYVAALRRRGADVEVHYRAMGHRSAHTGRGAESITTQITFVRSRVGTRPPDRKAGA
ncbi:hypothetical protein DN402_06025 [Streptomyces sp. SW4]|nr:hypothetical protein DN402_06025 [Streptomyces sp. SW4]